MNKKEIKEELIKLTNASIEYKNKRNQINRAKKERPKNRRAK